MPTPSARPVPLTDAQREVLSAAARRSDGAAVVPTRLRGNAAKAVIKALLDRGLVREIRARGELPVWRSDPDVGHAFALVATKAGRAAVPEAVVAAVEPPAMLPRAAVAVVASVSPSGTPLLSDDVVPSTPDTPRKGSKLAAVIALLGREQGTSVAEVMRATGWLPHTTRAALSGLRKRGYALTRESGEGGPRYRIETRPAAAA